MINFFVDSHTILSTQRVHGTSAARCFLGSMVQWYTGSGVPLPFPSPVKLLCCRYLNFRRASDLHVPCYWCEMLQGMGYTSCSWKHMFFSFFRFSFRNTNNLSPFPFSATSQVMNNHTRNRQNLTGKFYFVCKHCWIYLRHVSTLHEPCRGCAMMESIGWEFWTPGRGRSAWWRHPCWMFILIFFIQLDSHWIIQRLMIFKSWPIPHKLCIVNYQGWSSLLHLFKRNRFFSPKTHWILDHFDFTQDWILIELFCIQSFKGVTPLRRHTRPACN